MKVSDYVAQFLADRGLQDIFLVSGGGIMHLIDSVGSNSGLRYYCNYHEQACAICAEGYARITGKPGVCMATTGPGGANALSGAIASWYDSLPLLVISGQVRQDIIADYTKLRQVGPQEANITGMAQAVTKYAKTVSDAQDIRFELEKAVHLATSGRPGPVWIEIPLNIQGAQLDEATLRPFIPEPPQADANKLRDEVRGVIELLRASKRPIFVAGNGIRRAGAESLLREALDRTHIPIALPHVGKDLVEEDYPTYMGIFGTTGQRRANFAVQNSDCLISLGTGLNIHKVGFNVAGFAPKATRVIVDIDKGQLDFQTVRPDVPILADIGEFLQEFNRQLDGARIEASTGWLEACRNWKRRYPIIVDDFRKDKEHVNSYVFMDKLSDATLASDIVVTGNGLDTVSFCQAFKVKKDQRAMTTGWGSMGWDLPLAIGTCISRDRARTVCVTGDGSFQWNIQELLTLRRYNLPVKIFVFNNDGYSTIRATQSNFFEGRFVGSDFQSGVANPDYCKLAAAYGLPYGYIRNHEDLEAGIDAALKIEGPALWEVNISPGQGVSPKASAFRRADGTFESRPLEDMEPFLSREEIFENMHLFDEPEPVGAMNDGEVRRT